MGMMTAYIVWKTTSLGVWKSEYLHFYKQKGEILIKILKYMRFKLTKWVKNDDQKEQRLALIQFFKIVAGCLFLAAVTEMCC